MKKEDEIFRKLDKEKPIVRRSPRDDQGDAYARPVSSRRRAVPEQGGAYTEPAPRRRPAPEQGGAYAEPASSRRRPAPEQGGAYAEPASSRRRPAPEQGGAYAEPVSRRRPASEQGGAYAEPAPRRRPAPEQGGTYAEPAPRRRTAPEQGGAYAEPVSRRRTAPEQGDTYSEPAPRRRTAPEQGGAYAEPAPRRRTASEQGGAYSDPAPRRRTAPAPQNAPRREASRAYSGDGLLTVSDKPANMFSRPYKLTPDSSDRAELRQRHELKYYLNYGDYTVLRQKMRGLLRIDEHADENGSYYIRSLYYDDLYNTAAVEKMAGSDPRYKYRIRIYNFDKSVIRFEKKIKTGKFISKDSFGMSYDEYLALRDGDIEFLLHKKAPLAKEIYLQMRQGLLKPAVIVDYEREPFVMSYEDIRITFDKNLRTGEPNRDIFDPQLPVMPLMPLNTVIMEVKFQKALPEYIQRVINAADAMQNSAASKYIICRQYD